MAEDGSWRLSPAYDLTIMPGVPAEKLPACYARSLANLKRAMRDVPIVLVFDNDDLGAPYRRLATCENGARTFLAKPMPDWLSQLL